MNSSAFPIPMPTPTRDQVIEMHMNIVHALVGCLWGRRRFEYLEKDDLVAVGYTGLIKAVDSYDPSRGASLETWIRNCSINAIRDALRAVGFNVETEAFDENAHGAVTTSKTDSQAEAHATLEALLPQLPENQRRAISLHYIEGHKPVDVAREMQISRVHAGRLITGGLERLQQLAAR